MPAATAVLGDAPTTIKFRPILVLLMSTANAKINRTEKVTEFGKRRTLPFTTSDSGVGEMIAVPLVTLWVIPRKTAFVASVATIGIMFTLEIRKPFTDPSAPAITIVDTIAIGSESTPK